MPVGVQSLTDKNSRGWGLLLRVAGIILPLVAPFVAAVTSDAGPRAEAPVILRQLAFVWGWPWHGYQAWPLGFGLMGAVTVVFIAAMLLRKDRRGAVAILIWSLFWTWVVFAYAVTDPS